MRRFFVRTKRQRFRHLTVLIQCCRCRPERPNVTVLSTTARARSPCTLPLTLRLGAYWQNRGRHTSAEFVAFLADIASHQPKGKETYIICDNLSAHKTPRVERFLADHSTVSIHYTPTYFSWLKSVRTVVCQNRAQCHRPRHFTSVTDLKRKLMRYIRQYNKTPKPMKWIYRNTTNCITTN
ncbi:MAG: transposase [Candidatus Binatia bacterium]